MGQVANEMSANVTIEYVKDNVHEFVARKDFVKVKILMMIRLTNHHSGVKGTNTSMNCSIHAS